ncbi:restriction endonuclease [Streptomyces murinus]|uniref:restriction endonuclease n=1 Tax=Streptomyces murinus TaxID=33900 RepID=UPI002E146795|nr:restriction endonuclease [Streptomyces murinus]
MGGINTLTVLSSKTRTFDKRAPEGTLQEISQFFRRHPNLYHSVSPTYLEKLTARVFKEFGNYAEVRHVGRPADGGVDVLLIEDEEHSWLVQVKRRENPTKGESVETIRNLLGTMVLEGKTFGAVVSTADHFTLPAREAASGSTRNGVKVPYLPRPGNTDPHQAAETIITSALAPEVLIPARLPQHRQISDAE